MDHKMAESNYLVEKYMSDEMSGEERTDFEEHMFDCPVCSDRVRQDFTIIENLKALSPSKVLSPAPASTRTYRWQEWLRIPSLVPTFAAIALACIVGYQHFGGGAEEMIQVLPQMAALQPVTRGSHAVAMIPVNRKLRTFQLSFDTSSVAAGSFVFEVQDDSGKKILSRDVDKVNTALDLSIQLPEKEFPAGRYQLVLRPASEPDSIVTYPFAIQDAE